MSTSALTVPAPMTIVDPQERERLTRHLILPKATNEQIALALAICDRYGFDPLLRHVLFISGNLYVTRDGLRHLANSHPMFDGYLRPEFERDEDNKWIVTVAVCRKDRTHPFYAIAYQSESENTQSPVWRSHPRLMTQKVAECMALRMAFSTSLGTAEEVGYDGMSSKIGEPRAFIDAEPADDAPPPPLRALPAPAPVAVPPEFAATPMPEDEFIALRSLLIGMVDDGLAESEIVKEMQGYKPKVSGAQFTELRRKYAELIRARKATPPAASEDRIGDESDGSAGDDRAWAERDDFGAVVGPPAAPAPAERVGTAQSAKLVAIKELCRMKHIPLAEVEGQAIARWSVADLALLTPAQADELLGELQRAGLRETAGVR